MFLDCPPSVSLVSENVLHAADVIVVPLIPTTLSVRTLEQLSDFVDEFKGHRPEILAFFSMVDRRKKLHREITEKLTAERYEVARTAHPRPLRHRDDVGGARPGRRLRAGKRGGEGLPRPVGRAARPRGIAEQLTASGGAADPAACSRDGRAAGMGPVLARDRPSAGCGRAVAGWTVSTLQPGAQPVHVGEDLTAQRPLARRRPAWPAA